MSDALAIYTKIQKESSVLLWFFHGVEIFGIHNHFLEPLFRSGYFHRIPDVSLKNFWKYTGVCSLWHVCISLYTDSLYSFGNPKLSMIAMLTGSFSNIILDYIFIFPLHMGIFGAVLATGLAPVISLIVLSRHWFTKQNQFHLVRINPSFRLTGAIISLGIPSFITEMASGIVIIVFNAIILHLQGNIGVAAYGVVANLSLVVISIYTGIAQGTQPILSRVYGYGEHDSQKQILKYALKTMLVISCGIYLIFLLSANPIVSVFNSEQNVQLQRIAVTGLKLYFTAIPFVGFNIIISAYFTSTEKAFPAQIISLLRGFLIIIPMAFFLSFLLKMTGVWLSFPITECFVTLTGIALYIKSERGKKNV